MWLYLRSLPNMKGTVNCSCSCKVCSWQPYIRIWDQYHGTETESNSLGFRRAHAWGRGGCGDRHQEVHSVASGPTLFLAWKPEVPPQGQQESVLGLAASHWTLVCSNSHVSANSFKIYVKSQEEAGKPSPLVWGRLRKTFWKESKVSKDLGFGEKTFFRWWATIFLIKLYLCLKGGC